jgi:hypothetical protein
MSSETTRRAARLIELAFNRVEGEGVKSRAVMGIKRSCTAAQKSARGFVLNYIDTVRRCHDDEQCVVVAAM